MRRGSEQQLVTVTEETSPAQGQELPTEAEEGLGTAEKFRKWERGQVRSSWAGGACSARQHLGFIVGRGLGQHGEAPQYVGQVGVLEASCWMQPCTPPWEGADQGLPGWWVGREGPATMAADPQTPGGMTWRRPS